MSDNDYSWIQHFARFHLHMHRKMMDNICDDELTWKDKSEPQLLEHMEKSRLNKDWISVANVAFMIWERKL